MSRTDRLFHATSFRLAAAQTAIFVALLVAMGGLALGALRHANDRALEEGLVVQADRLKEVQVRAGAPGLVRAIEVLQRDTDDWELRLSDRSGARLAGDLPDPGWPDGLATRTLVEGDRRGEPPEPIRAFTTPLGDGLRLTVGRDLTAGRRADAVAAFALAVIVGVVLAFGLGLGAVVGRRVLRRIDDMGSAIGAYAGGDRAARVRVGPQGRSDLDALAQELNRMLDRETALTEGLRRVSAAVAHDLRGPLARHNQEIDRALAGPGDGATLKAALAEARDRVDEVLAVFRVMLQLAELEAGAPGVPRERLDLYAVAGKVVEAYLPGAQDAGRPLSLEGEAGAWVVAEDRLLGRMISNLIENALTHTPPGARVLVRVDARGPRLHVSDDGPGVPEGEEEAIFKPFHRIDAARGTPGSGLGLALVAAAAHAFNASAAAQNARPGLRATIDFGSERELVG